MTVAAQAWAWRQQLPIKPKFVLVTLADQADERTGRVCYGKTDMKFLAAKCGVPERSLYRYIGALILNGYVMRESGKEKGHASEYWLCLDRAPAEDMSEFQWRDSDQQEPPEPEDVPDVEGSATLAEGVNPVDNPENESQFGRGGPPLVAEQESLESPKLPSRVREAKPQAGFSRQAQDLERGEIELKKLAEQQGAKQFVIQGTRAWDEWIAYRRRRGLPGTMPSCWGETPYGRRRGWYMPTLFPPKETGPPRTGLLTDDDERELAQHGL